MAEETVPFNEKGKLSLLRLLAICANQLSSNLIWTPIGLLLNPMCQQFDINAACTTLIILIGPISGMIVPPLVAPLSDKCTLKWGRRRIFLVIGEIGAVVGLLFLAFCDRIGSTNAVHITFLVLGQLIVSVFGNVFNGPGRSLCSDLAPESQQVVVSNFCQVHGGLAGLISNIVGAVKLYEKAHMDNAQFVLLISCIVGFVALVISILASHEEQCTNPPNVEFSNPIKVVFQSFKLHQIESLDLIWIKHHEIIIL